MLTTLVPFLGSQVHFSVLPGNCERKGLGARAIALGGHGDPRGAPARSGYDSHFL